MGLATESQFHVLAVDDSLIDRKVIERLLRTSSYQVTTVDSGSKALEFLGLNENDQNEPNRPSVSPNSHREIEVNLIITDYCMPGMTGYDLLKKIKESSFRNIPVVIMSSENVQSRITRCLEEGAEEFFLKPVRASDLHKIKTHMMKTKMQNQKQECQQKLGGSEIPSFVLQENQLKLPQLVSQELHRQPLVSLELQHQSLVSQEMQHLLASQGLQEQCAVSHKPQEQQQSTLQEPQGQQLKQPMLQEILEQQLQQPFLQEQLDTQQQLMIEEQQKQSLSQSNNNKRKSMEEGLSPDCTRPRHDGIVTTV